MFVWISGSETPTWPIRHVFRRKTTGKRSDPQHAGRRIFRGGIMSAIGIDAEVDVAAARSGAGEISRRLESLPASAYLWRLVILLSLGGCFEIYDLFFTGYIAPGLNRSGLLTTTTQAFFGFSGIG